MPFTADFGWMPVFLKDRKSQGHVEIWPGLLLVKCPPANI